VISGKQAGTFLWADPFDEHHAVGITEENVVLYFNPKKFEVTRPGQHSFPRQRHRRSPVLELCVTEEIKPGEYSLEPLIRLCQEKGVWKAVFLKYVGARWDEIALKRGDHGIHDQYQNGIRRTTSTITDSV